MRKVKATDSPENCVFCGTYYFPMLSVLDHAVCHDCWNEVVALAKQKECC